MTESTPVRDGARRVVLFVGGAGLAAYGYLVTVATSLGNGPLFAVQDALHRRLGWSLGATATVVGLVIVLLAACLSAPIGPGTMALPPVTGWWIAALEHHVVAADEPTGRWLLFLGGTAVMMLGGVLVYRSSLGSSALDGVMLGLSDRFGTAPRRARLVMEALMAGTGAALGGRVGAGTLVMGASVGHLFTFWDRRIDRIAGVGSARRVRRTGDHHEAGAERDGVNDVGALVHAQAHPAGASTAT